MCIRDRSGNVRLSGLIPDLAVPCAIHTEDLALLAGAHVEGAIGAHGQRPDVARLGREVFGDLAILDAVDLAIGRGAGVKRTGAIHGEGENLGLGRGPQQRALGGTFDLVQAAAMSGSGVDRAVGGLGQGPDDGLIAGEQGLDLGGEGEPAFAAQREAAETSTDKIGIRIQLPRSGAAGERGRGERRAQNGGTGEVTQGKSHSFTSSWTVLDPVTAMSPTSISISAILELRVWVIPAELDCELARIKEIEAGGSGRSAPSNWNAGSARQTRT